MTIYTVTLGKKSEGEKKILQVDWERLPAIAKEKIIAYGVQRTFNDACGGAEHTIEDKVSIVEEMIADYYAGEIGRKRAEAVPTELAVQRQLVRAAVKVRLGGKHPTWKDFLGLSDADQVAKLDAWAAKFPAEELAKEVAAEIARRAAKPKLKMTGDF